MRVSFLTCLAFGLVISGNVNAACTGGIEGQMEYETITNVYRYCNGIDWVNITNGAGDKITEGDTVVETVDAGDGYITLTEDGTEYLRLTGGNVGIGTTSPGYKLQVNGNAAVKGFFYAGEGVSTGDARIRAGEGRTASGYAYLDLVGDTTYSDYGLRLLRGNTGANTTSEIIHRGTGDFKLIGLEPSSMKFVINSTLRMIINGTTGYVGIGTLSPSTELDVNGKIGINGTQMLYYPEGNFTGTLVIGDGGGALSYASGNDGQYNTFVGIGVGNSNTSGNFNTATGVDALYSNTTGHSNTANGVKALYANTTGANNTANGLYAGRYLANGSTGNATGSSSVFLGSNTKANADGETNQIVIGHDATGAGSNSVVLGNDSITKTVLKGRIDLASYGTGTNTGTMAYNLAVDSSGNVIEVTGGDIPICIDDMSKIEIGHTCDDGSKFLGSHPNFAWQGFYAADIDQSSGTDWNTAISMCKNLSRHGHTDWYLPSRFELDHILYENRSAIGGFANSGYWSFTENNTADAWGQNFSNGDRFYIPKSVSMDVRCVRRG